MIDWVQNWFDNVSERLSMVLCQSGRMQKWSSARSLLDTALAYAFINELADRKESMVIKFSDGITLSDIKSTADRV